MTNSFISSGPLFAVLFLAMSLVGCSVNDNPTSADQMHNIRVKEAADRANFHPSGAPPGAPSTTGK